MNPASDIMQRQVAAHDSALLSIDGARCAGCILKLEKSLGDVPGVIQARGNATSKRIHLSWDPARQTRDTLVRKIRSQGFEAFPIEDASARKPPSLLVPLAVAGFGTMNIMALSLSVWFGAVSDMGHGTQQFMHWASAAIAAPVVAYSGAPFYGPAIRGLRAGSLTMDFPISLAIVITFGASLWETWLGRDQAYFDAVVSLIFLLLIGRVLEQTLQRRTGDAAENIRSLGRVTARKLVKDGTTAEIRSGDLVPGDLVAVAPGEQVPADAQLLNRATDIDESLLTGESRLRKAEPGEVLTQGSIVMSAQATLKVIRAGDDAYLAQMAGLAETAAAHKGNLQHLADRFARGYLPTVLIGGIAGFVLWYIFFGAEFRDALMIAVAVLIVTCPCAAGLATPAVSARAANLMLRHGIVVKSGDAIERLAQADTAVLDKTGTLSVPSLATPDAYNPQLLAAARRLAAASSHPLAKALLGPARGRPSETAVEIAGQGIKDSSGARLGSAAFVGAASEDGSPLPSIWFRSETGSPARFAFRDQARPDTEPMLDQLHRLGIETVLLSGDRGDSVERFATELNFPSWHASNTPEMKLDLIRRFASSGRKPLMVGDGINDALALSGAHVSMSFGGASQIAQSAADIVLVRPNLRLIGTAITLARDSNRLIAQNLAFATIYNLLTVPLALAGLLTPFLAALFMSSSSILVLANGLRLRARP